MTPPTMPPIIAGGIDEAGEEGVGDGASDAGRGGADVELPDGVDGEVVL